MKSNRVNGRRTHRRCGECGKYIYENENDEWCANPYCEEFGILQPLDEEEMYDRFWFPSDYDDGDY